MEEKITRTLVFCPDRQFLAPYMGRAFGHETVFVCAQLPAELPVDVSRAVMISSTDIYAVTRGRNLDESTPLLGSSPWNGLEQDFTRFCASNNLRPLLLRCANIVGTGMNGLPMRLARGIDNGTLFHIKGNEAEISVVHAVDVAAVACRLAGTEGIYNVTDGCHTRIDALIDALAFRMNDKTVFSLSARPARLLYGKTYYGILTDTLLFDDGALVQATGAMPMHPVCEYLRTHVYDESSL